MARIVKEFFMRNTDRHRDSGGLGGGSRSVYNTMDAVSLVVERLEPRGEARGTGGWFDPSHGNKAFP